MTETIPEASFYDERLDMAYWYDKLNDVNVPIPESQPLPTERNEDKPPTWDSELAQEIVENLGGEAFVRSGYKSAQIDLDRGSHIRSIEPREVNQTLKELVSQHMMMQMPLGESLWLREWVDVEWCMYADSMLVPEVRAFIRDGEVVCYHPRLEGFENHPDHRETAESIIESAWPEDLEVGIRDHVGLEVYAERVAEEFDGWWSVDFILDRNGEWWCTDMALDALYERDGQQRGISAHPEDCQHDIEKL